jgi:hypothetical protein
MRAQLTAILLSLALCGCCALPPAQEKGGEQQEGEAGGGLWEGEENWGSCSCPGGFFNQSSKACQACAQGQVSYTDPFGRQHCYTPSGHQGEPCDRQTDCGTGHCALVNESAASGKGVCRDVMLGCNVWIDGNGSFDTDAVLCID